MRVALQSTYSMIFTLILISTLLYLPSHLLTNNIMRLKNISLLDPKT